MASATSQLVDECRRQSESCLYTSTSMFIWLRCLRRFRIAFVIVNALCGGVAGWSILKASTDPDCRFIGALFALLAGVLPAIYSALKADDGLARCAMLAGEFKNLQDRFRQAALIGAKKPFPEFEKSFQRLMDRMERARAGSYTTPEWCFRAAQKKIGSTDYKFEVDTEPDVPAKRG